MSTSRLVHIRGGRVLDRSGERQGDVLINDGRIVAVGDVAAIGNEGITLDASGALVAPGLVDLHAHLREPGDEAAETIETGSRAAALGGYTAVVAMPNTDPPIDDTVVVDAVLRRAQDASCAVFPAGCITKGRAGQDLAPLAALYNRGVRIFTDDGAFVADAALMRNAFEYVSGLPGAILAQHCEDPALCGNGAMHEGEWSARLGIPGRSSAAEEAAVARDLVLAGATRSRLHILHISTAGAVEMVREAKRRGIPVTAEVAPHHFTLTDAACATYDPVFKVHPPLRSAADRQAVRAGLADGTIDAIATDHAPHPSYLKEQSFEDAPPGMLGLETALALTITELVENGVLSMAQAIEKLSWQPASIAGLSEHGRPIAVGEPANLCVIDPAISWEVDLASLASKAVNSPYVGHKLTGRVRHTILAGSPVVIDGQPQR